MRDTLVLVTPGSHRLTASQEFRHLERFGERSLLLKDDHCFAMRCYLPAVAAN
jgi:hypothetical protein